MKHNSGSAVVHTVQSVYENPNETHVHKINTKKIPVIYIPTSS